MRLNKIFKSLAVALPLIVLSACSSTSDEDAESQLDTNAQTEMHSTDNIQISAAQRALEIEEQKQREIERLRTEHIVYFDFDTSTISAQYTTVIEAHAGFLRQNPDVNVIVEGHTDERGTPEYNIALGERRAKAVATYLQNMGVSSSQLNIVSYGEEKAMVTDRSESAFAQNRRAVIVY